MQESMKDPTSSRIAEARVAVVIVNYRTPDLTRSCVLSLQQERKLLPKLHAVVVDGGSGDGSAEALATMAAQPEFSDWVSFVPFNLNGGFGWANNQAILLLAQDEQPPEFIYLLNPDAQITRGAVAALVEELHSEPRCAAVGSQLLNEDESLAASAFRFPSAGHELTAAARSEKLGRLLGIAPIVIGAKKSVDVDWVTGASVLFRCEALRDVGLFDDGFFLYFEEVELMHRLRARGWKIRHVPGSRVFHLEGAATCLGSAGAQPYAKYWYDSRRRYFALTGGRASLLAANLGWIAGRIAALPKRLLGRPTASRARLSDLLRLPWASTDDLSPSVPAWGDTPGTPPAWITRK